LLAPQRTISLILNIFALAGLLLCTLGIYSVMAYSIQQRVREIGIRMALGAEKRHIITNVLLKGSLVSSLGIAVGLGLSLVMIRLMEIVLPGLQRWDKFILHSVDLWSPGFLLLNSIMVMAVTLLACLIPARRATKIDPMEALRYE
jgi:putative ABC transport system permease protein